jgi:hypothetical protein
MVIRDPQLTEDTLTYKIEVLDGKLPAKVGPACYSSTRLAGPCRLRRPLVSTAAIDDVIAGAFRC